MKGVYFRTPKTRRSLSSNGLRGAIVRWSGHVKTEKNYNYKSVGGMHKIRFGGLRFQVMLRDGYRCVICGMTNEEHLERYGRDLTLDHIDGYGRYSEVVHNTMDNLQTLCLPCHGRKSYNERSVI